MLPDRQGTFSCVRMFDILYSLKFLPPTQHFTDIVDDQFDFHSYCMRKMTLRPYIR